MNIYSSATDIKGKALSSGILWGFLGVAAFSLTVPLTRVAVGSLPATFVGVGRLAGAGILALIVLLITKQHFPQKQYWLSICVVAFGVVFGFPMFTSFALQHVPSSHAAVVIALLPVSTAVAAVLRTRDFPRPIFWVFAILGAIVALTFVFVGSGLHSIHTADLLLLAAVVTAAVGYAEGGVLARSLGAWQTISWALVFSLPISIPLSIASWPDSHASTTALLCFTYLTVVSMYLGFFAWYHGLSIGPMTQTSQIQLIQPVLTLIWSWTLLKEEFSLAVAVAGAAVVATAIVAVRARAH